MFAVPVEGCVAVTVSAHVLDAVHGGPVGGVGVRLDRLLGGDWLVLAQGSTDSGGRFARFESGDAPVAGVYRWVFAAGEYFTARSIESFHPEIPVVFTIADPRQNYHVPVLLSPFSYTTYRGH